jgi:sterol 3beta-glucosyltransferase
MLPLGALSTVVLTTVGSTGDVVPHLALALGLRARGHRVRVATHAFHRALFEAAGIEHVAVGPPLTLPAFNRAVDDVSRVAAPIKQFEQLVRRLFLLEPGRTVAELSAAMADAELVVAQRFDYLGQAAAVQRGLPWATVNLSPQLLRTAEAPVHPAPDLGRVWTRFTWTTLEQMAAPMNRSVADVLARLGVRDHPLEVAGARSPQLDLVATSWHLSPTRGDWPTTVRVTGPWFLPPSPGPLEPALAEFLARHGPPVVVSFGSMGGSRSAIADAVLEALVRLGRPAVVQRGYANLLAERALPEHILSVGHVPHDLLFGKAACVVHHAGVGTAAAVAAAGVPSVAVPHLFDQFYWGARLAELGAAAKPLLVRELTGPALAARIEAALQPPVVRAAAALGARVRSERGVEQAVAALEALMGGVGAAPP